MRDKKNYTYRPHLRFIQLISHTKKRKLPQRIKMPNMNEKKMASACEDS